MQFNKPQESNEKQQSELVRYILTHTCNEVTNISLEHVVLYLLPTYIDHD